MYHSITFGQKNTWADWHLVPTSRPLFVPPSIKTKMLDIPGGDGVIDLTESITGYPVYNNREGSFEFIVLNEYSHLIRTESEWCERYSKIMDHLHGYQMQAILEDDDKYYYEGRFMVNDWKSDKDYSRITIDYSVKPYKRARSITTETMGVNTTNTKFSFNTQKVGRAPICPTFRVSTTKNGGVKIRFVNSKLGIDYSTTLSNGTKQIPEVVLYGDSMSLYLQCASSGDSGTVYMDFRPGRL